jgi:hypothetical protein
MKRMSPRRRRFRTGLSLVVMATSLFLLGLSVGSIVALELLR